MDNLTAEQRRRNMQNIRSSGTKMEDQVSRGLWHQGIRFRKHQKDLPGRPDISIKKYKLAVFLDSCFFHGCPDHLKVPSTNIEFWIKKIARNQLRDEAVNFMYQEKGWTILRFWEHQVKRDPDFVIQSIIQKISRK